MMDDTAACITLCTTKFYRIVAGRGIENKDPIEDKEKKERPGRWRRNDDRKAVGFILGILIRLPR